MTIDRDDLVKHLREGIVTIVFTKFDGTERTINATLEPSKLPLVETNNKPKAKPSDHNLVRVFDTDIKEWRSFWIDSIIEVKGFKLFWNKFLVAK